MKSREPSADKQALIEEALGKLAEARQENARLREELTRASAGKDRVGNVVPIRRGRR